MSAIACGREKSSTTQPLQPTDANTLESSLDVTEGQLLGVGRVLIKEGGWQIPHLPSETREFANPIAKTIDGVEVPVDLTTYRLEFGSLVPADAMLAMRLDEWRLQKAYEYRIEGHPFAYAFQISKKGVRVITNYTIYDEDGDGLLETLVPDDRTFNTTLRPHVPKWAFVKTKRIK